MQIAKGVRCPALLMPCSNDPRNLKPGGKFAQALRDGEHGEHSRSVEFKNVLHGFMTRSVDDPKYDASVAKDREYALSLAVTFIVEAHKRALTVR